MAKITITNGMTALAVRTAINAMNTELYAGWLVDAPASATATGVKGQFAIDGTYIYFCTATNTWVRGALATATWS